MRVKLSESPHFAKLKDEGAVTKAPLREAFARRDSLQAGRRSPSSASCARQGAVWYFTFFYMQVFLEKSLGLPGATKDLLLIAMTLVQRAALRLLRLALRPRRPQAGDARRDAARAGALLPRLAPDRPRRPTRRWSRRSTRTPVVVETDPATCSAQFDPTGTGQVHQRLRHRQEHAGHARHLLHRRAPRPTARRGSWPASESCRSRAARARDADLKALKADVGDRGQCRARQRPAIPSRPTRARSIMPLLLAVLLLFVVAATALYGPQAAALVEMFPTRIRYTAMCLPYHVGTGWVGGFLPVTSFAIVAADRRYLRRPLVLGRLHRHFGGRHPAASSRKPAASRSRKCLAVSAPSGCRSAARPRPAPGRSAASSSARRRSPARAVRAFRSPVMVISMVRADRIADRVSVTRGTGASVGQRVGHHPDGAAGLGRIERVLQVGAGEDRRGVPVLAHAEPDEVGRPVQVLQPGVGGIARQPVVGDVGGDRDHPRPEREERSWRCARTLLRSSSIGTSRSSVGMMVTFFHCSLRLASLADRPRGLAAGTARSAPRPGRRARFR